jgi:hypothetical protein
MAMPLTECPEMHEELNQLRRSRGRDDESPEKQSRVLEGRILARSDTSEALLGATAFV